MATTNLFQSLVKYGDDTHFNPVVTNDFKPTTAPAGSPEKIETLAYRLSRGVPLWHPLDGCQDDELVELASSYRPNGTKAKYA
jgi:hypothetical protein